MSDGFIFWYERSWSADHAARRIAGLDAAGLSLAHPDTGRITAISNDPDTIGDQITLDRTGVIRLASLHDRDEFSFQYWLDHDIDVFSTIKRLHDDVIVQRLYLDGLTTDQQNHVAHLVLDHLRATPDTTIGLVVDRHGTSQDVDWDSVATGGEAPVTAIPDLIALPQNMITKYPLLAGQTTTRIASLTIACRPELRSAFDQRLRVISRHR